MDSVILHLCFYAFLFKLQICWPFLKDSIHTFKFTLKFPYFLVIIFFHELFISQNLPESYHLPKAIRIYVNSWLHIWNSSLGLMCCKAEIKPELRRLLLKGGRGQTQFYSICAFLKKLRADVPRQWKDWQTCLDMNMMWNM